MADKTFTVQQRGVPAKCRSRRLRLAGMKPSETIGLMRHRYVAGRVAADGGTPVWVYDPGSGPANPRIVDRGLWQDPKVTAGLAPYLAKSYNPDTTHYEWHAVWHMGCRWMCAYDETNRKPAPERDFWTLDTFFEDLYLSLRKEVDAAGNTIVTGDLFNQRTGAKVEVQTATPLRFSVTLERDDCSLASDREWENNHKNLGYMPTLVFSPDFIEQSQLTVRVRVELTVKENYHLHALRDSNEEYVYDSNGRLVITGGTSENHHFMSRITI